MLESPYLPILFGAGVPAASLGIEGQMYCDTAASYKPYVKHSGAWTALPTGGGSGALTLIGSTTTAGSQTSVTFSAIAGTYKSLEYEIAASSLTAATVDNVQMQFNGDTGANYYGENLSYAGGTAGTPSETLAVTSIRVGPISAANALPATHDGMITGKIINYSGTTRVKTTKATSHHMRNTTATNTFNAEAGGWWNNTAAITQITFILSSGAGFLNGSVFSLYGRS